jgi:uncharacterized protein (TIGR00369 family)
MVAITVENFNRIVSEELVHMAALGLCAEAIGDGDARLRLPYATASLRPGGSISGPTIMGLADATMYAALLGRIGLVKMALTTNFNMNFLRLPPPADLIAEGRVIKAGKRLAVLEVTVFTDGEADPVAHATGTYSIPPRNDGN